MEWRSLVHAAMQYYFRHFETELGLDNEDLLDDFYTDLYDAETFTLRLFTLHTQSILSTFSTTSSTPVLVSNSAQIHTFTYPNAIIRAYNVPLTNNNAAGSTKAKVDVEGETPVDLGDVVVTGTAGRECSVVGRWENLPVGESVNIRMMIWAISNTAIMGATPTLVYEVEEWE